MPEDEPVDLAAVTVDAEAIDDALAAFEDACAQLIQAAENAASRPRPGRHLAALRDQLEAVSVPVTSATADALVLVAADARAALQRILAPGDGDGDTAEEVTATDPVLDLSPEPDPEPEPEADPVLDLSPEEAEEPEEAPPAPRGYRACVSLPTRNVPHVLVHEDGRWQRAAVVFGADDALMVRAATARVGLGRRLEEYRPAQIALPYAQG